MGLWDKLKGELVDIVEWPDPDPAALVYRFERYANEIKYGAQLIVREGQAAVFVNMGQIADVFQPGMYELHTENLPILSTLMGWEYGFRSPFKAEVYFVSTRNFTDLKWGTKNPIMHRDPEFGPIRLRAFGTYTMRATDPAKLIREVVGTDAHFSLDEITEQLRDMIVARFADALGESKLAALDLAANYDELGALLAGKIRPEFASYGLELTKLLVENISLPSEVEQALDKRSSMGVIGDLKAFTQYQAATAMETAAQQPGGLAGLGVGAGMGMAMAAQMASAAQPAPAPPGAVPPPIPQPAAFFVALGGQQSGPFDLAVLGQMVQAGQLTRDTLVWRQGMAQWAAAGTVAELSGLFPPQPPPLPPQP